MTKKISIKKLAEELNLAPSTVHRALSGHPNVSVSTRREVLRFSQAKGYRLPVHEKVRKTAFAALGVHLCRSGIK